MDLNHVDIIGRLVRNPETNYTQNGKAKMTFSVASSDGYGENQYTNYFDVVVWGKPAETLKNYLYQGKQVCISGRIRQDRWEKDGQKRSKISVIAENVQLLGNSQDNANSAKNYGTSETQGGSIDDFPEDLF